MKLEKEVKIGLLGIRGRMGQWVNGLIDTEYEKRALVMAAPDRGDSPDPLLSCDVVIDFSSPEGALALIDVCIEKSKSVPLVLGTTGWSAEEKEKIKEASKFLPLFWASNFSAGVFLLEKILRDNAKYFKQFGYMPAIVETHHVHKKDSPSGTALSLQKSFQGVYAEKEVPISSVRAGEVIGDHEVRLHGPGDILTLAHRAQDRSIFARGAIEAALWMADRQRNNSLKNGLYSMEDLFR